MFKATAYVSESEPTVLPVGDNNSRPKLRKKLTEEESQDKISKSLKIIEECLQKLSEFKNDLVAYENKEFFIITRNLYLQYFAFKNYIVSLKVLENLRKFNAGTIIRLNGVELIGEFLEQFINEIIHEEPEKEINTKLSKVLDRLLLVIMNYSDASSEFGLEVCKSDRLLRTYLKIQEKYAQPCLDETLHKSRLTILKRSISTLYNLLLYEEEANMLKIREWNFFDILQPLLRSTNDQIKLSVLLFTAYIINEADAVLFTTDQSSITYLLNLVVRSMKTRNLRSTGLSTLELTKGIDKLSKNDENKQLLVDLGVLNILKTILERKNATMKLKEVAISILWNLAFDERNRQLIIELLKGDLLNMNHTLNDILTDNQNKNEEQLFFGKSSESEKSGSEGVDDDKIKTEDEDNDEVEKEKIDVEQIGEEEQEENIEKPSIIEQKLEMINTKKSCKKTLDGLMWTLQDSKPSRSTLSAPMAPMFSSLPSKSRGHIMISYCWSNKSIVLKIYDTLKSKGYNLWIDKYNMVETENIMESMAEAVEDSDIVIICVSQSYKDSKNCRAEAGYARSKNKHLIPIMVQKKYRPDGWLGFCITGLQYIDFVGRYDYKTAIDMLKTQIAQYMPNIDKSDNTDLIEMTKIIENREEPTPPTSTFKSWGHSEVIDWFKTLSITNYRWDQEYGGAELEFLKYLQKNALESFIGICTTKLQLLNLKDLRIFHEELLKL